MIEDSEFLPHSDSAKKLKFPIFVRLLLYFYLNRLDSLRSLITDLKDADCVSAAGLIHCGLSTIHDAFLRYQSALFQRLYQNLLQELPLPPIKEFQELGRVAFVDGSIFPMAINTYWACFKERANALKMHLCLSLNQMIPVCFLNTVAKQDERAILRQLIERGITYVADRGYVDLKLFSELIEAGAHFIIRLRKNLKYQIQKILPVELPESVKFIFSKVTDELVQYECDPENKLYRRISFKTRTTYFILVTDRLDLTTFEVIKLYCLRWQIELFFRYFKCTVGASHLINTSERGVTTQFYMILMVHLLLVVFKQKQYQQYLFTKKELQTAKTEEDKKQTIHCQKHIYHSTEEFVATIGKAIPDLYKIKKQEWRTIKNKLFKTEIQICFNFP